MLSPIYGLIRLRREADRESYGASDLCDARRQSIVHSVRYSHAGIRMSCTRRTRMAWWRRLGALFVAACIVLGPLEALAIPDTHDGDTIASHLAAPEHSDATLPHAPTSDRSDAPGAPLSSSEHSTHVDHCVHGHLLGAPQRSESSSWIVACDAAECSVPRLHESVGPAPQQRPPIDG